MHERHLTKSGEGSSRVCLKSIRFCIKGPYYGNNLYEPFSKKSREEKRLKTVDLEQFVNFPIAIDKKMPRIYS